MVTKAELKRIAKREDENEKKFGAVLALIGLAVAFLSWAYFMFAPNPSLYFGILLVLAALICCCRAIFEFIQSTLWRVISISILVIAMVPIVYWCRHQWETNIRAAVESQLSMNLAVPSSGDAWDSILTTSNNSNFKLTERRSTCEVSELRSGVLSITNVPISSVQPDDDLSPGGDAQTKGCLGVPGGNRAIRLNSNIDCADVIVLMQFTIETSPRIQSEKRLRFVYGYGGQRLWVSESVNGYHSYCPKAN